MATIYVNGLPEGVDQKALATLCDLLRMRTFKEEGIDEKKKDLLVYFPKDHLQEGLGQEFSILIHGLHGKRQLDAEQRTTVRKVLGVVLGGILDKFFPKALFIEINIAPFVNLPNEGNGWFHDIFMDERGRSA